MGFIKELDKSGVFFLMTNNDCDFIRERCEEFDLSSISTKRFIDALTYRGKGTNKTVREDVKELFVKNY